FESKFGNQLEFLKLGMQYITIGAEIFEAVNNLSMYKQIYDLEAEQTEEEIVEDVFEMEILETIQCVRGGSEEFRFVNQFRYFVTAGMYWAGLKACSGTELTSADILPFRMIANATGPKYRDRQMVNYWSDVESDDEHYVFNVMNYIRNARNYIVATMIGSFSCTDFMLIDIARNQLDCSVNLLYLEWHKLYNAGQIFNKRLYTHHKDSFDSKNMALFADYIFDGNFFSRLIAAYPDVGEFVDQYVGYFRSNAD
ncbi:hypothetical protein IW150_000524, partial [Coemansia sp. RSA 2607]